MPMLNQRDGQTGEQIDHGHGYGNGHADSAASQSSQKLSAEFLSGAAAEILKPLDGAKQMLGLTGAQAHEVPHSAAYNAGAMVGQAVDFTALAMLTRKMPALAGHQAASAIFAGGTLGFFNPLKQGESGDKRLISALSGAGTIAIMESSSGLLGRSSTLVGGIWKSAISGAAAGAAATQFNSKLEKGHWATSGETLGGAASWALVGATLHGGAGLLGKVGRSVKSESVKSELVESGHSLSGNTAHESEPLSALEQQTLRSNVESYFAGHAPQETSAGVDKLLHSFNHDAYRNAIATLDQGSDRWAFIGMTKEEYIGKIAFKTVNTFGEQWPQWLEGQKSFAGKGVASASYELGAMHQYAQHLPLLPGSEQVALREFILRNPEAKAGLNVVSRRMENSPAESDWLFKQSDDQVKAAMNVWQHMPELPAPLAVRANSSSILERMALKSAWEKLAPELSPAERAQFSTQTFDLENQPALLNLYKKELSQGSDAILQNANVSSLLVQERWPNLPAQTARSIISHAESLADNTAGGATAAKILMKFDLESYQAALKEIEPKPEGGVQAIDVTKWWSRDEKAFSLVNLFGKDWQEWLQKRSPAGATDAAKYDFLKDFRIPAASSTELAPLKAFLLRNSSIEDESLKALLDRLSSSKVQSLQELSKLSDQDILKVAKVWQLAPELPISVAQQFAGEPTIKVVAATVHYREILAKENAQTAVVDTNNVDALDRIVYGQHDLLGEGNAKFLEDFEKDLPAVVSRGKYVLLPQFGSTEAAISVFHPTLKKEQAASLAKAAEMLRDEPSEQVKLVGADFKSGVYSRLIATMDRANAGAVTSDWQATAALSATNIFGKDAPAWLSKQMARGIDAHDATHWLPAYTVKEAAGLSKVLQVNATRNERDLALVARRWSTISPEARRGSLSQITANLRAAQYQEVKSPSFAKEALRWDVSADNYSAEESRFLASLAVPSPFPLNKSWHSGGLTGQFLPRSDARGLYLGEHTNCCQHPSGAGALCAWFGQENARSGFFVVKDKADNIVAQSWSWLADDGGLVFDSIESKGLGQRAEKVAQIYQDAATDLSKEFGTVSAGKGTDRLNINRWPDAGQNLKPLPVAYKNGYSDAKEQVVLAKSDGSQKSVETLNISPPPVIFRPQGNVSKSGYAVRLGEGEQDKNAADKIAQAVYPPDWKYVSDGDVSLILSSAKQGEIGYASIDLASREINDLAVLPGYRPQSQLLLKAIYSFMEQNQKQAGEVWHATLRQSTTDRLLNFYDRQGKISIVSREQNGDMNGEPMFDVKFILNGKRGN